MLPIVTFSISSSSYGNSGEHVPEILDLLNLKFLDIDLHTYIHTYKLLHLFKTLLPETALYNKNSVTNKWIHKYLFQNK